MFPLLHPQIVDAVGKDICPAWENNAQQDGQCTNDYDTNVSGQFRCSNRACFKVWGSGLVAIRRMAFDDNRYNAIVYNQHCKKCNSLGIMKLDEARYVERVSYRLKKWAGVRQEMPPCQAKSGPPHMDELCEGCIQGHCRQGKRDDLISGFQNLAFG
ncbi:hypothetical protein M0657_010038 [Pyricularia oryzae]|uniref:3CxxC-type domain-containing protein n=1 Tax=Pyricularia grisea TaxID=148305 RepID=A0A6P8BH25_PYRGI|nr:uncharacterized protein PgNI_01046 [Pyricularia grisea]KAI7913423.1 hypothetical protein M0657_010038 [Pyricularia oryzae]TLD15952.1 hypothetical protein PgNI_01046 [Pyricularia grisea]